MEQCKESNNKSTAVLALSVLATSIMMQHHYIIAAAISSIRQYYASYPQAMINLIPSAPFIGMIPSMLLCGWLTSFIRYKTIIQCGFLIIVITGVASAFTNSLPLFIFLRILIGVGVGAVAPFQGSLIPKIFTGTMVATIFGLQSVIINLFGSGFSYLGGLLANLNWRYPSLLYAVAVIAIIIAGIFLPKGELPKAAPGGAERFKFKPRLLRLMIFMYFNHLAVFSAMINLSYFMTETGLGGPAETGSSLALFGLSAAAMGLIYGKFYKVGKKFIFPAGVFCLIAGNFLIASSSNTITIRIGVIFLGFALTCTLPTGLRQLSTMYDFRHSSLASSFFLVMTNLSILTLPFVTDLIIWIIPGGNYKVSFFVFSLLALVLFLLATFSIKRSYLVVME